MDDIFTGNSAVDDIITDEIRNHDFLTRILIAYLEDKKLLNWQEFNTYAKAYISEFAHKQYSEQFKND